MIKSCSVRGILCIGAASRQGTLPTSRRSRSSHIQLREVMTEKRVWAGTIVSLLALSAVCVDRHANLPRVDSSVRELSAPSLAPAQLEIRIDGSAVNLVGRVPNAQQRATIVDAAKKTFGSENVVENIETGGNVAPPTWVEQTGTLFALLQRTVHSGSVVIRDKNLIVRAELGNEDAKTKLLRELIKATGEQLTVNDQITIRNPTVARSKASLVPLQGQIDRRLQGRTVEFDSGSTKIKPRSYQLLDEITAILRETPDAKIEIGGHTDSKGDQEKNLQLSLRRADAVKKYMVGKGIVADRLTAQGYGDSQPLTDDESPEGLRQNRRIGFRVLENE
jgi:OmpA-OmpF porin, OOP family